MRNKLLASAALAVAMSFGSTAFADSDRKNVYKESQPNAKAKPAEGAVNPCAAKKRSGLYKESQPSANAKPNSGAVNPCAPAKAKGLYKESAPAAMPKTK